MSEKLLTIVVPSYNAERFLPKGIPTFMKSEIMDELEVLIVDDGSTDGTPDMADDFEKKYPSVVKAIHKKNGGHGSTINVGIDMARGKYFGVVDADDWVDSDNFVKLFKFLKKINVDLVLTDVDVVDEKGIRFGHELIKGVAPDKKFDFKTNVHKIKNIEMHNYVIKTEILRKSGMRCHEKHFYVDMEYHLYPLRYINDAIYLKMPVYQYLVGRDGQSISLRSKRKNFRQYFEVAEYLIDYYLHNKEKMTVSQKDYYTRKTAHFSGAIYGILLSYYDWKNKKKEAIRFDNWLKKKSMDIYKANDFFAVKLLRLSQFGLFHVGSFAYRKVNKVNDKE